MIDLFDNLLRQVLIDQVGELTDESQVRFQPPDADWRTYVANLTVSGNPANALNLYLADLRENRKLRSNERVRSVEGGVVSEEPAPARLDCHYLVSAWSPATVSPTVEPTLDEHALLYQAVAVLMRQAPFNPSRVYPAGSAALGAWPAPFRDYELPAVVAPVEGFNKLAEFWSGMGAGALWKPALYLIVTLPVALLTEVTGPMVTTRITEYRVTGSAATGEVLIEIGGHVLLPPRPLSVGNATVNVGGAGNPMTVNNAAPFRVGDIVTHNGTARQTITLIAGNDVTLNNPLPGLAAGNTVRIANLVPSQHSFRLDDVSGLTPGGTALITGEDAANPGTTATESVVVQGISGDGFVTLALVPARAVTYNLNVAPAAAPALRGFAVGAWVRLEDTTGTALETTTTDADGRFKFAGLAAGNYILRVRALGLAETTLNITVPSATGNYDVQL